MMRLIFAAVLSAALFAVGQASAADPNSYPRPVGQAPAVSVDSAWQMHPFNFGYSLTGGYRGLYSGAPQPVGHETIATHGGNGYIYRPVYGEQPFYGWQHYGSYGVVTGSQQLNHGSRGTALVIDNPGTPYERRYSPSAWEGSGHAVLIDTMPTYAFNGYGHAGYSDAAYYGDYSGYSAYPPFPGYGTPATYLGPSVDAPAPAANSGFETAEELPNGDLRLRDGTIVPKASVSTPQGKPAVKQPEPLPEPKPGKKAASGGKPAEF